MKILSQREPKARKNHICNYCGGTIKEGEVYQTAFIEFYGDCYEWKNHKRCNKIAHKLDMFDDNRDEGLDQDSFQEYITDQYLELTPEVEMYSDLPDFQERLDVVCSHFLTD